MRRAELEIRALNAFQAVEKLSRAGIEVFSARLNEKNSITLQVNRKDLQKVFAILRGSCYNIKKVRPRGVSRAIAVAVKRAGLLAGALAFVLGTLLFERTILSVRIVGSGAYYAAEVSDVLARGGVKRFGSLPKDTSQMTAEILSLPRVSFCTIGKKGGVLTVTVEVTDENGHRASGPLASPVSGTVEELVVVRGTACVAVGDAVSAGGMLVSDEVAVGEETRKVLVIARAKIAYFFSAEYEADEEGALSRAQAEFGEIRDISSQKTDKGVLVTGTAFAVAAINLA